MTEGKRNESDLSEVSKIFPEKFSERRTRNRAPTQAFLTFFNVVRGYVGRGYGGSPPYVFHVEHNVKKT